MVDVLMSYSRHDEAKGAQLARMVEAEGLKVWWDADLIRQAEVRFGG
jgi:hypothetical protein